MTRKQQSTISVLKYGNGTVDTTLVSQNVPRKARKLRFYCVFCNYIRETEHEKERKEGRKWKSVRYIWHNKISKSNVWTWPQQFFAVNLSNPLSSLLTVPVKLHLIGQNNDCYSTLYAVSLNTITVINFIYKFYLYFCSIFVISIWFLHCLFQKFLF